MKANINTLKQALELTCKAHRNTKIEFYPEENQIGIFDTHVPIITDVERICTAFFGNTNALEIDYSWSIMTIYLNQGTFLPEVDIETLDSALPFEWVKSIVGFEEKDNQYIARFDED